MAPLTCVGHLLRRQRALAAVFACGEGAALSHISAAVHWQLLKYWPSMPQLTVPGKTGRRGPKGVALHHTLNPETTVHDRIPITNLARTLHDIAPTLQTHVLKAAVRQAEIQHRLDLATLIPRGALRRFLAGYVSVAGATNDFEADFLELCATHGIPRPLTQYRIDPYRVDFAWFAEGIIVETDGRASHDGFVAFSDDRAKMRFLQARGYAVLQFTYQDVKHRPAEVAAEVREALRRRRPPSVRV